MAKIGENGVFIVKRASTVCYELPPSSPLKGRKFFFKIFFALEVGLGQEELQGIKMKLKNKEVIYLYVCFGRTKGGSIKIRPSKLNARPKRNKMCIKRRKKKFDELCGLRAVE